jgi:hypothetical protein
MKKTLVNLMIIAGIAFSASAQAITIDGKLDDWGLKQNGNINDWIPDAKIVPSKDQYKVEDLTGGRNAYLTPGYGGQAYDAEAIYVSKDSGNLYIALITGLSPNTQNTGGDYGPGDFAIDFGQDGSFEFGIQTTGNDAGKVFTVSAWDYGLWDVNNQYINSSHSPANPGHPTSIKTSTWVADGELSYKNEYFTNMGEYIKDQHYVIEAAIPLSAFNGYSGKFDVHWTMNCANDSIWADPELTVPEPGTLALIPLGLLGLAALRRRKTA